jgi:hypothetical protein
MVPLNGPSLNMKTHLISHVGGDHDVGGRQLHCWQWAYSPLIAARSAAAELISWLPLGTQQ